MERAIGGDPVADPRANLKQAKRLIVVEVQTDQIGVLCSIS
jgi:hypothetical protein